MNPFFFQTLCEFLVGEGFLFVFAADKLPDAVLDGLGAAVGGISGYRGGKQRPEGDDASGILDIFSAGGPADRGCSPF